MKQLQINKISKEYGDRIILDGVGFSILEKEAIGLVGTNGSGKTTLMRILAGLEKADNGSVIKIPSNLSIGYIPQVNDFEPNKNITDCLAESVNLDESENYLIYIALDKLGISETVVKNFGELSAGQKTKVYLARLLLMTPDILLLDEPTNHLDIESLDWLENYLKDYKGSYLVVSHDRRFLDNSVTKILELDEGKIKVYGGNYSDYRQQKLTGEEARERAYVDQEKKAERIIERVQIMKNKTRQLEAVTTGADHYMRRKAAKSASKAKSTEKMLNKQLEERGIEKPEIKPELAVLFRPKVESSQSVVFLNRVSMNYGEKIIIDNISLVIEKGDKIALTGANGSGKSTLIKLIMNEISPTSGKIERGNNVEIGYLPQEHIELVSNETLLNYLINKSKIDRTAAFKLAKRFLLTEDDMKTEVNKLSSGQKSKLALATIMTSGANFIILDEPTNYLDIESREALEEALVSYTGTLLVVSHDRYFLENLGHSWRLNYLLLK